MLQPVLKKNDRKASAMIMAFSFIVFVAVIALSRVKLDIDPGFDVHVFATFNAITNSLVALLLLLALFAVKAKRYLLHKRLMMTAMVLSILFLVSYICHHLLAGNTLYGDIDKNGIVSDAEVEALGGMQTLYRVVLFTHIPLAGIILPFILFTAYRALIAEFPRHKRLARITWPIWFYVAITGVVVYLMISPYY